MLRTGAILFSFLIFTACSRNCFCPQPVTEVIETEQGPVRGVLENDGRVFAFKGIPFAETTAGENRWKPPVPKQPWTEPFPATKFGPPCPQFTIPPNTPLPGIIGAENCLNLNVWTPAGIRNDAALPVLVYLYGGGFLNGFDAIPMLDGAYLAEQNQVVVVNLNYRLGAFGFLALNELDGNYGYMDQVLALQWVRQNIAAFGGDPDRVTLIGESAGAIATGVHLTADASQGLLRAGIMLSNPYGVPLKTLAEAKILGEQFSKLAFCGDGDRVACLRAKPAEKIVLAQQLYAALPLLFGSGLDLALVWGPAIDGTLIKAQPAAENIDEPILLGTTADEGALFIQPIPVFIGAGMYRVVLEKLFSPAARDLILARYPPEFNNANQMTRIVTEYAFACSNRYVAGRARGEVFLYDFTHVPTYNYLPVPGCHKKACHSSELPFLFHYRPFIKGGQPELAFADSIGVYFTNFAKTENPGKGAPVPALWPDWNPGTELLDLNLKFSTQNDPHREACAFWDQIGYYDRKDVWKRVLDLRKVTLEKQVREILKP